MSDTCSTPEECVTSISILVGTAKENSCPKIVGVDDSIKIDFKVTGFEDVD
jgi:hypothetical protein